MKLLIWLLLLFPICSFAQPDQPDHISIDFEGSVSKEFLINIYRSERNVKIIYTVRDSTSDAVSEPYEKMSSTMSKIHDRDSIETFRAEMDSLWKTYSFYRSDSLEFSTSLHKDYLELLAVIFSAEKCDFINQSPNIVTGDGYSVSLIIKFKKHYLRIGASNPGMHSYPLLTKFLMETLKIGFNSTCHHFLKNETTYIRP
jgi:hypothetical protein